MLSLVVSSLNSVCGDFSIFSAVMPRSPFPLFNLVWNFTIFCNQVPKVLEGIHLLQFLILNEYAARYAVAGHYLGFVDVDD